ncbi:MAG: hypothetical protein ABI561_11380 [Bradyrhizobium sp.]
MMTKLRSLRIAPLLAFGRWFNRTREPTLAEILSDSLIGAVMESDGVDPTALGIELRNMARRTNLRQEIAPLRESRDVAES